MLSVWLTLLLGVVIVLLITAVTGYFVSQEFAFMAVDRSRLAALADQGDKPARRALAVTKRTSFMLSGAQLGITVTGLLVGYAAEPLIGASLASLLGGSDSTAGWAIATGAVLALAFSTVVQMVGGELFPKNLAIARAEPLARWLAPSTAFYLGIFGWLIWIFDKSSTAFLRILRIEPVHDVEHSASERDLQNIVAASREQGELPEELSMMIDRIIDFPRRTVEHAMIPRSRAGSVTQHVTVGELKQVMETGHSRYPVLDDDGDRILGVVHLMDVLRAEGDDDAPIGTIQRPALVISHLMKLTDALTELTQSHNQLACVVDEYGGFCGVLTIEDLAEEVVGEITDEHDAASPDLAVASTEDEWFAPGDLHVDEVERSTGVHLPRGDYETIAGLAIASVGRLPAPGESADVPLPPEPDDLIDHDSPRTRYLRITVLEVENHVPSQVKLALIDSPCANEPNPSNRSNERARDDD